MGYGCDVIVVETDVRWSVVRTLAAISVVLVTASMVEGCGRRGRLEPAPDPEAAPRDAASNKAGVRRRPARPAIVAPDTPFILDPLL